MILYCYTVTAFETSAAAGGILAPPKDWKARSECLGGCRPPHSHAVRVAERNRPHMPLFVRGSPNHSVLYTCRPTSLPPRAPAAVHRAGAVLLPPELHQAPLNSVVRLGGADPGPRRVRAGHHGFQLLMLGRHPYAGASWVRARC